MKDNIIEHYKLVRDRIPEILKEKGIEFYSHIANKEEYEQELYEKLREELQEFEDEPCVEELADMLEVLDAIRSFHNINLDELKTVKTKKSRERGGFKNRIILDTTIE